MVGTLQGGVRVGSVAAAVERQIAKFKQNVSDMCKRVLRACWRRIRQRMVAERLTGRAYRWWQNSSEKGYGGEKPPPGAPLAKKTGNLIRSMDGFISAQGDIVKLDAQIGKGAYYAEQHEESGRLQFKRIAREEMEKAQAEIAQNYAVLAQLRGQHLSAESAALIEASETVFSSDAGRSALISEMRAENRARRNSINARQRARRAKDSGQRAFKMSTKGFGAFGISGPASGLSSPTIGESLTVRVGDP